MPITVLITRAGYFFFILRAFDSTASIEAIISSFLFYYQLFYWFCFINSRIIALVLSVLRYYFAIAGHLSPDSFHVSSLQPLIFSSMISLFHFRASDNGTDRFHICSLLSPFLWYGLIQPSGNMVFSFTYRLCAWFSLWFVYKRFEAQSYFFRLS